jgi:hypothetical protein
VSLPRGFLSLGALPGEHSEVPARATPTLFTVWNDVHRCARGTGLCVTEMAYPGTVTTESSDIQFAEEAGERIEQAFALCAFASQLVGKASEG